MTDGISLSSSTSADAGKLGKAFQRLRERAESGILRPIVAAASKVVAEAERAAAPEQSGLLAESIGVSTARTYRAAGGNRLFVAAGVRWGFRRTVSQVNGRLKIDRSSRPMSGEAGTRDPAKYLWVVTHGREAVAATDRKILYDAFTNRFLGKQVPQARANPFIQQAYDEIAPQLASTIASQGAAAITRESGL